MPNHSMSLGRVGLGGSEAKMRGLSWHAHHLAGCDLVERPSPWAWVAPLTDAQIRRPSRCCLESGGPSGLCVRVAPVTHPSAGVAATTCAVVVSFAHSVLVRHALFPTA